MPALSKSSLLLGRRCPRALWNERRRPDLAEPPSEARRAEVEEGRALGRLARALFPGGTLVGAEDPAAALVETREALAAGAAVLFEAAFEHAGVFARADVLRRAAGGGVEVLEVKRGTQVRPEHLLDVAVQRFVLEGAGLPVARAGLLLLDAGYERRGDLDLAALFRRHDVTTGTDPAAHGVAALARDLAAVPDLPRAPPADLGERCREPWPCPFTASCREGLPDWTIYDLRGLPDATRAALRARGIVAPEAIPDDVPLPAKARAVVAIARAGREVVDREAVRGFLGSIAWPVHALDFEAVGPAVPPFEGTRPFDVIPFQWSLHVQEAPGGPARHQAFLADGGGDFRREVAERLVAAVGPRGSVLCWTPYEARCLERLEAACEGSVAAGLRAIRARLLDLATPFRERWIGLPAARGSYSLKQVLPAVAGDLSYDDLALRDGLAAARAFRRLADAAATPAERAALRADLERYCGRDTEATLRVLEAVRARA